MATEATIVRTTKEAMDTALIPLLEQFNPDRADASGIMAPYIEGPPGIGKTEVIIQLAKQLGVQKLVMISCGVIDTNLEFIGLPDIIRTKVPIAQEAGSMACVKELDVSTGESKILEMGTVDKVVTKWIKPDRLAEFDTLKGNDRGLLVFDDTHFLLENNQAMLMQLLTNNRTIHTHRIGEGANVAVMFLANGENDNANASPQIAPFLDRLKYIHIDLDAKKQAVLWVDWARSEGLNDAVISFIDKEPNFIYTFYDTQSSNSDQQAKFASPRGWANFAREMTNLETINRGGKNLDDVVFKSFPNASPEIKKTFAELSSKFLDSTLSNYASGTVGGKAAAAFTGYYKVFQKYDLDKFMNKPEAVKTIPKEELLTAAYRFGVSLARELIKLDETMYNQLIVYTANNLDKIRSVDGRQETAAYGVLEKYGKNLDTLATAPKEEIEKMQSFVGAMLLLKKNGLVTPPSTILNQLTKDVEEGTISAENIESAIKREFKGTLSAIKSSGVEDKLVQMLSFMGAFQKHLLEVERERRSLHCSTFYGAFIGEISRNAKKDSRVNAFNFRDDHKIERDVLELFIRIVLKKHPEFMEMFSYRQTADVLVQQQEQPAQAKKSRSKEL